jgi:serine acetyltransferase
MNTLITVSDYATQHPLKSTGTIRATSTIGAGATIANGIDLSNGVTITGSAFKSPGFNVDAI